MKKYILLFLLLAPCSMLQTRAQNYVVTSLATPGAATFKADEIAEGVINLPFAATKQAIKIETNQQDVTVSSDADWCQAAFANDTLTLTATENSADDARTAILTVRSKDLRPMLLTVRQEARLVFAVISDTHIGNNVGEGPMKKVPQALQNLTRYGKLDALAVVGDLTDHGDANQYVDFDSLFSHPDIILNPVDRFLFMMGNHDNYNSNGQTNYKAGLKNFNIRNGKPTNYPLNQYVLIKGYPFITLSVLGGANNDDNSNSGFDSYPDETITYLNSALNRATRDAPGKPIFIFAHVAPRNTCYSTWGDLEGAAWAMWRLNNSNLRKCPQAVVFCGHSHYPLGDPRSIHQGANPNSKNKNYYTVINTASTTYSEINPGAVNAGIHPEGYEYVTEGMILVEQPNGDIEIRRYDTYRDVEIDPEHRWVLKAPFDGSMFQYADIRDKDDNPNNVPLRDGLPAPEFVSTNNTPVTVDAYPTDATVRFDQAVDDECVFRYRVRLLKGGNEVKSAFVFSQFYLTTDMPRQISYTFDGLTENTEYTAEVVAYDSYDNQSAPLTATFTTPADDAPVPDPVGCWTFDDPNDLLAGTGIATLQGSHHSKGSVDIYANPYEAGLDACEGPAEDNGAVAISLGSSLLMTTNLNAQSLDTYSFLMDIHVPEVRGFNALYQNDLTNTKDASLFINGSGQVGKSVADLGYHGLITSNGWYRVVFVVRGKKAKLYIDGIQVGQSTSENAFNWLMSTGALFFADEDEEESLVQAAEIRFWDKALTAKQVADLGTTIPGEDPAEVVIPEALGVWTFDNPDNLLAGTGTATLQGTTHSTTGQGNVTVAGNLANAGIVPVEGPAEGNGAVTVPKGSSLLMASNLNETSMTTYSIMWDVKGSDLAPYSPLLQNDLNNKKDGSLFFYKNKVGLNGSHGLGYNGNIINDKWYRILFVVENGFGTVYVDGTPVGQSLQSCEQHWKLTTGALFFADNDGEETELQTAEIRFWNVALSIAQAKKLGDASYAEDPNPDPVPQAKGTWTFDNADNLLEGTGVSTLQPTKHTKGNVKVSTLANAGIVTVAGPSEGNGAVLVPKNSSLLMTSNLEATTLTSYSILWDVRADNYSPYIPLLQNDLNDNKDGSLFISKNKVGINVGGLLYNGNLTNGNWYRIVFVVKDNYATVYVNGEMVGSSSSPVESHWKLSTGALFFADEDGEETAIETAEIRFWDEVLTASQVQTLGTAGQ